MKIFLKETLFFFVFIIRFILKGSFFKRLKYSKKKRGTISILGNGPSLEKAFPTFKESADKREYCVMNFFALDSVFLEIKPEHYFLADHVFFKKTYLEDKVQKLFDIFNEQITWKMNIYIPVSLQKEFYKNRKLINNYIEIITVNNQDYRGYKYLRNYIYINNFAAPRFQTVAIMAIYVAIIKRYKTIKLYGFEHDFTKTLYVNDKNQLCNIDLHFYDDKLETEAKPILKDKDTVWKIGDFLSAISKMFIAHDDLACFSKYTDTTIINCTENSYIDSYQREYK